MNILQVNNQKQSLTFGTYRIPKTEKGFEIIKSISVTVPTSHIILNRKYPVAVTLLDMAFWRRLRTQNERRAYLEHISSSNNAPLITPETFRKLSPSALMAKVTMNEGRFGLFLDILRKRGIS